MKYVVGLTIVKPKTTYTIESKETYRNTCGFSTTLFKVSCSVCKQDPELFGDGTFLTGTRNLTNSPRYCCGCSLKYQGYSNPQQTIRLQRVLGEGYEVILPQYTINAKTTLEVKHSCGEYYPDTSNNILNLRSKCLSCYGKYDPYIKALEEVEILGNIKAKGYIDFSWVILGSKVRYSTFKYQCTKGHTVHQSVEAFRRDGVRCVRCGDGTTKRRLSSDFDKEVKTCCEKSGVSFVKWSATPTSIYDKFSWLCYCGTPNSTSFDNFVRGRRCKVCKSVVRDFKGTRYLYVATWLTTENSVVKFGITKQTKPITRVNDFGKNTDVVSLERLLLFEFNGNYSIAGILEGYVKSHYSDKSLTSADYQDGYTEVSTKYKEQEIEQLICYYLSLSKENYIKRGIECK